MTHQANPHHPASHNHKPIHPPASADGAEDHLAHRPGKTTHSYLAQLTKPATLLSLAIFIFLFIALPLFVLSMYERFDDRSKAEQTALPQPESRLAQFPAVVKYAVIAYIPPLPSDPTRVDDVTLDGLWGQTLDQVETKVRTEITLTEQSLEDGSLSRFSVHAGQPLLDYQQVGALTVYNEYVPKGLRINDDKEGVDPLFRPDYIKILNRENICDLVDNQGVREIWLWTYHNKEVEPAESNMSMGERSQKYFNYPNHGYGDVSNSEKTNDLPTCFNTYTLFNYNLIVGVPNHIEDHTHHFEAIFNWLDERDIVPVEQRDKLLFWGKFVGNEYGKVVQNPGCGWTHFPPNGVDDYDWRNTTEVESDCNNWNPDRTGAKEPMNCTEWSQRPMCPDDGGLAFKIWWMQHFPGIGNGFTFAGRPVSNWWRWISDFDASLLSGGALLEADTNPQFAISQTGETITLRRTPRVPDLAPLAIQVKDSVGLVTRHTLFPNQCDTEGCTYSFTTRPPAANASRYDAAWRIYWDRYLPDYSSSSIVQIDQQAPWVMEADQNDSYSSWIVRCQGDACPGDVAPPTPQPLPDLVISKLETDKQVYTVGETVSITVGVTNRGDATVPADASAFFLGVYPTSQLTDQSTVTPASTPVFSLTQGIRQQINPGETYERTITNGSSVFGTNGDRPFSLYAVADPDNEIVESNENDVAFRANTFLVREVEAPPETPPDPPPSEKPILSLIDTHAQLTFAERVAGDNVCWIYQGVSNFKDVNAYQYAVDEAQYSSIHEFSSLDIDTSDENSYKYFTCVPISEIGEGQHIIQVKFLTSTSDLASDPISKTTTYHIIPTDCSEQRFDYEPDSRINIQDYAKFLLNWKEFNDQELFGDFNCDRKINIQDYNAFLSDWRKLLLN